MIYILWHVQTKEWYQHVIYNLIENASAKISTKISYRDHICIVYSGTHSKQVLPVEIKYNLTCEPADTTEPFDQDSA